ncbi:uncharacterized protein [Triticum aestivum]|uniref:uncharacterized protein n=1 Tax=Triticum aestivum TaxID=4565 RepID=UPI001D01D9D6|nr:uncharacterized protein LOC123094806 [Triticum aestivum]
MAASSSFPWPEPSPTREVMLCSSVDLVCIAYNLRFELKPSTTSPSGRLPRHGHGAIAVDLHHRRLPAVPGTSTTSLEMLEPWSQTPPSTMTPYYTGGAYYYVQPADDDQE